MAKPNILLISTGGTITMTPEAAGGVVPTLTGAQLVAAVPSLADHCTLEVLSYSTKPGASLTVSDLVEISKIIQEAFQKNTSGAIVVQGTDTIEETAFVLDLLVASDNPVVVTGAMRSAAMMGADGPANLLSSAIVAASKEARKQGTLVVLNDEIHAARRVQKMDTAALGAFVSSGFGPLGRIVERQAVFNSTITRTPTLALPSSETAPVALVKVGLDDDGRALKMTSQLGYQGAVIEAMGAGHLPSHFSEIAGNLASIMPVVLSTRVPAGPIFLNTYGFPGSEMDLLSRGLWPSGYLGSLKSRLLLMLLLSGDKKENDLKEAFLERALLL